MKKMVILSVLSCLLIRAQAQFPNQQQFLSSLDSFTQKLLERIPVIPAITVTVVNENGAIFNKAYGWSDKEAGIKADLNTEYYIASSTKSFTALAAALLDNEKKIMLDSPIKKYFPNVHFTADIGDDVTARTLLTHTSGLQNGPLTFRMAYTGSIKRDDMMKLLSEATTVKQKPGQYKYDNLGYNIYGLAMQEYLHLKWQDVLQDKIFTPLGMKRTTAYISLAKKNRWNIARPYNGYGPNGVQRIELEKTDNTMQSAGGLITTPSDIVLWLQAQINSGKINNKQVFPGQIMTMVHTGVAAFEKGSGLFDSPGAYGLGWFVGRYNDEKIIYHFGGYAGFKAHISYMPDKKIGLAVFTNEGTIGDPATDLIAEFVYGWLTGKNVQEISGRRLDQLEDSHQKATEGTQKGYADRAKRTWQLSMPMENYTGKYNHPYFGEMDVTIENNALAIRMGNLHAVSTPFTQKETIRVELETPGVGQVVSFKLDENGKVTSLSYQGQEYKRVM